MSKRNLPPRNAFQNQSIGDYVLDDEIGRGKIGVVYLAHHKDIPDLVKACKIIPTGNLTAHWERELIKVGKLSGIPQVVQHHAHGPAILESKPYIWILWEYVPGMNLRQYCKEYPQLVTLPFVENVLDQLLSVFHAMKETKVSHDDLHEGNILVNFSDPRLPDQVPRLKISDFGIGGSRSRMKPKDDYMQLAVICHNMLDRCIDPSYLDGEERSFYKHLVEEFLPKFLLESNPTVGDFVKAPLRLLSIVKEMRKQATQDTRPVPIARLKHPFDYLSCEHMGDAFELLQKLYTRNFPGYDELLLRNNTILTGPRGCGKTTIFKNLSLKTRLLGGRAAVTNLDGFIGVYYHCSDLYYAFPYLRGELSKAERRIIVHYFNLALLSEILDVLVIAGDYPNGEVDSLSLTKVQEYISTWLPDYQSPTQGTSILRHLRAFILRKKQQLRTQLAGIPRVRTGERFLPLDFLPNLCKLFQENIMWVRGKPIYFFIDDYSLPRISEGIQSTLNDLLLSRYHGCIFKISTESITTFFPYDSTKRLLEETREYDVIDLGDYFLHASDKIRRDFLLEVINNRLKNSEAINPKYNDISSILGKSHYPSYNHLAREIRQATAGAHVYYYGWDMVAALCSGDIAHILSLVRDIFFLAGGYAKFYQPDDIDTPLDKRLQDRAARELGNDFLTRIEAVPDTGKNLRKIAEAFGTVANLYLRTRNSKNQARNPPWQAFRIEVRETPHLEDAETQRRYVDLIRCAVFLRDVRGKSQRGAVVPRLYLRRLLLPTFLLTPSRRDNIGLETSEFLLLLNEPDKFVDLMKTKRPMDTKQGRFSL